MRVAYACLRWRRRWRQARHAQWGAQPPLLPPPTTPRPPRPCRLGASIRASSSARPTRVICTASGWSARGARIQPPSLAPTCAHPSWRLTAAPRRETRLHLAGPNPKPACPNRQPSACSPHPSAIRVQPHAATIRACPAAYPTPDPDQVLAQLSTRAAAAYLCHGARTAHDNERHNAPPDAPAEQRLCLQKPARLAA